MLTRVLPHADRKIPVLAAVKQKWLEKCQSLNCGGDNLREIKLDVRIWKPSYNRSRRIETVLAWLRFRHSDVTYTCIIEDMTKSPECDLCQTLITVKRILTVCAKCELADNKYCRNPSLATTLKDGNKFLIEFLKETSLFKTIKLSLIPFITLLTHSTFLLTLGVRMGH